MNSQVFFLISAPRSGSTWLSKAINLHPSIYCTEGRFFGDYADMVWDSANSNEPRLRVTLDKYVNSCFLHHNLDGLNKIEYKKQILKEFINIIIRNGLKQSGKKKFVDKITPYLHTSDLVLKSITELFPKSKIIYLLRDGRDVLTSGVFHWFNKIKDGDKLSDFETIRRDYFFNQNKDINLKRFFLDEEIEEWALTWAQPLSTINSFRINHEVLIIRYEEMLENQNEVLNEVFKFFGSKSTKRIVQSCVEDSSFKKMSGNREQGQAKQDAHIRKGISGDWKNYFTKQDGEIFHKYAGDMLLKFGYEKNENWYKTIN